MTQMNYFNKALSQFSTNMCVSGHPKTEQESLTFSSVNPLYYVTFTTCTLLASFILFQGFNTTDTVNTISLLCGFLIIFTGVYLLNLSREDPEGRHLMLGGEGSSYDVDGIPTDGMAALTTRRSIQARRSSEGHRRSISGSISFGHGRRSEDRLIHNYDIERDADQFGLADLDDDEDGSGDSGRKRTSFDKNLMNGSGVQKPQRSKTVEFEDTNPKRSLDVRNERLRRHKS